MGNRGVSKKGSAVSHSAAEWWASWALAPGSHLAAASQLPCSLTNSHPGRTHQRSISLPPPPLQPSLRPRSQLIQNLWPVASALPSSHFPTALHPSLLRPRSQLIENPWPVGSASELMQHRMAIINLAANIDTRIQKMYEVRQLFRLNNKRGRRGAGCDAA